MSADTENLADLLTEQYQDGPVCGSHLCGPFRAGRTRILKNRKATSYPGCVDASQCGSYVEDRWQWMEMSSPAGSRHGDSFALALIELLESKEEAEKLLHHRVPVSRRKHEPGKPSRLFQAVFYRLFSAGKI